MCLLRASVCRRSCDTPVHQRNLPRITQCLIQKAARARRVAEIPIGEGQLYSTLRSITHAHEEKCSVVGVGFGPSCQQQFIACCCTFRLDCSSFGVTLCSEDLCISGPIFRIVGAFEQRLDERASKIKLSEGESDLGAMAASWYMGGQYHIEFGKDLFRTLQSASAHRVHSPFEQQLGTRDWRYAVICIKCGGIADFGRVPFIHFRQQSCERAERVNAGIILRKFFTQNQCLTIVSSRLEQRGSFDVNLLR